MKVVRFFLSLCLIVFAGFLILLNASVPSVFAEPLPGGTLDPLEIPKYVTPLVIPPVMKDKAGDNSTNEYEIAVRQFDQQILPAPLPPTTVWSYGPAEDAVPEVAAPDPNSQFNYPAYTIETTANDPVDVRWINDLVDAGGNPLPHLLGPVVDQTLHWANPGPTPCMDPAKTKDCTTLEPTPYTGPVPIVTHVHGAHVQPHSDGYPEAWWLPAGVDPLLYESSGTLFDDATENNPGNLGYADYSYIQTQPATTLWYHDHTLGMTRLNVYAGPAGFWLIRGGMYDGAITQKNKKKMMPAVLPGPAPIAGQGVLPLNTPGDPVRNSIREIPVVIQDRSFNEDGSLFYPDNRAFFEGLNVQGTDADGQFPPGTGELQIPFVPDPVTGTDGRSDIAPIWNPEAFFNVMVVNGVSWPTIEVAPAQYRLRLLNGCNSRFLNLALNKMNNNNPNMPAGSIPFFQIGGDQGFLPQVVRINRGEATPLRGNGKIGRPVKTNRYVALLMGPAERADVIVDFRGLADGTVIRMINTAPDAPFGGFPDIPADPGTTGQVMEFVVNAALNGASDTDPAGATPATDPYKLVLNAEPANTAPIAATKTLSLNEEESATLCVTTDAEGNVEEVPGEVPPLCGGIGVPMAPKAALLGTFDPVTGATTPLLWSDPMTERPLQGDTQQWDIYNLTVDGHPIHLHLVRYQVLNRQLLDPVTMLPVGAPTPPEANETGFKDTVIAYPGEVTRLKATFDIAGLYVWHCHIVEHEDNEMMRPYCVDADANTDSCPDVP